MRSKRCTWGWTVGLGVTVSALLWFINPAGAIPLESWDDKIQPASIRFKVLTEFGGAAVLDKETQLVWEQSPQTTIHDWNAARLQCTSRTTGGRKGWRLPSVHELASLVDPNASNPALPLGHPFTNVQSEIFWSATPEPFSSPFAWIVVFDFGDVGFNHNSSLLRVWCVRGGMNTNAY